MDGATAKERRCPHSLPEQATEASPTLMTGLTEVKALMRKRCAAYCRVSPAYGGLSKQAVSGRAGSEEEATGVEEAIKEERDQDTLREKDPSSGCSLLSLPIMHCINTNARVTYFEITFMSQLEQ